MNENRESGSGRISSPFDRLAEEYDRWFEDSAVFEAELACLRALTEELPEPRLEIGVGPGRFARALAIGCGLDTAFNALRLAKKRNISVCRAAGEALPLRSASLGTVYLLFVLCFVHDRRQVLREANRVLRPGGKVVLGTVPASSAWGQSILEKKKNNNPFYRAVNLLEKAEAGALLDEAGFTLVEQRSALLKAPGATVDAADSRPGLKAGAGFVVLVGRKAGAVHKNLT